MFDDEDMEAYLEDIREAYIRQRRLESEANAAGDEFAARRHRMSYHNIKAEYEEKCGLLQAHMLRSFVQRVADDKRRKIEKRKIKKQRRGES